MEEKQKPMASSKPGLFLRSNTTVSLHERFSQVVMDQLMQSRRVTFDPALSQRVGGYASPPLVLLVKEEAPSPHQAAGLVPAWSCRARPVRRRRRSVWTRLGWPQVGRAQVGQAQVSRAQVSRAQVSRAQVSRRRPPGFWSFLRKYSWRGRLRRRHLPRPFLRGRSLQTRTAGPPRGHTWRGGGASALGGRGQGGVPTKRQLDAQLDDYMSLSKRRLDAQLDDYMSLSRRRLDQQLDEYMAMAGEPLPWD